MKTHTKKSVTLGKKKSVLSTALIAVTLLCSLVIGSILTMGFTVANAADDATPLTTVSNLEELLAAIEEAEGDETILVAGTINVPNQPIIIGDSDKTITLRRDESFGDTMISVRPPANYIPQNEKTITFQNLVIDGVNVENFAEATIAIHNSSEFINVSFINNMLDMTGGAVLAERGTISFDNCFFSDNSSYSAGHLSVHSLATVEISNSCFVKGYAVKSGGAISNGGVLHISNCEFADNHTDLIPEHPNFPNTGGAVHNVKTVKMENCTFYNNRSYNGGAIYSSTNSQLQLDSCVITNNSAEIGGGIFGLSKISISNSPILRNTANVEAADIYSDSDLSILNTETDIFEIIYAEKELTPLGWYSDCADSRFNGVIDETMLYDVPLNIQDTTSLIFVFEEDILPEKDLSEDDTDTDINDPEQGEGSGNNNPEEIKPDTSNEGIEDNNSDKDNTKEPDNEPNENDTPDSGDIDSGNDEPSIDDSELGNTDEDSDNTEQNTESDEPDNKTPTTPPSSNNHGNNSSGSGKRPKTNTDSEESSNSEIKATLDRQSTSYLQGYMDAVSNSDEQITRGQMAQIIYRLLTPESRDHFYTNEDYFSDVGDIRERDAINTLANANIIEGYNNQYRPHEYLTKAELATIAARFFDIESSPSDFIDMLGHWAENYVNKCVSAGLIVNGEIFSPDTSVSYGQAIDFISHVLQYGGTA